MKKHFVTFYSPGTFFAEVTEKPIDSWDVRVACAMAKNVTERYGAKPYAFRFSTRSRGEGELDSHVSRKSPLYYMNAKVLTLEELKSRRDGRDKILISNMENNGWNKIVQSRTGWKWSQPLKEGDVVL